MSIEQGCNQGAMIVQGKRLAVGGEVGGLLAGYVGSQ
jgi:hypothetical protein